MTAAVAPDDKLAGVVPEATFLATPKGDGTTATSTARRRDSFQRLSAVPVAPPTSTTDEGKHGHHHHQALPCCLILYVCVVAILCGFLVSGCHKAFVYSGCLLGINGCNSLNGYKYEKMGYILIKAFPEVPEEILYSSSSVVGAALCGLIIICLPHHLRQQVKGGGTCQSLVAVATGVGVPLRAAILRMSLAVLFLMSGGSLGAQGPSIQVCTSFAMLAGWYSGIRAAVTQSLLASLGFSCGFAASFNAPLAGITFALEELQHVSTRLTQATIYMIMVAAALSTAVARATAGNYQLFQPTWAEDILQSIEGGSVDKILGKKMWMLIAIPIAVACSLCGFVISKSTSVLHRLVQKYRPLAPLPVAFALQALITASFGALVFRTTGLRGVWGIGAESLQIAMTKTVPLGHLLLFAIGKGLALILGMAVRCPADMLEPVLITGGFLGGAIGSLLPQEDTELLQGGTVMPCIIFGMVGLFASCFRFSLTPIVIVLEIVGTESYSLILPAVLCGFTASTCSDHLFPALLEDILEQDGINLQELAEQAEETFEADDAAREREESEEESVETNGRSMNRHGTSKSHKSRHSGSAPSEGSDRAMSRQNSEAPLSFLRRGLEESLYQQSTAKTKSRTVTIRDGANLLSRSNSHRYHPQSQRHSLPELTSESLCGRLAESGGKIEIPLQGLRNPVDLRFQVHEVVDGDGHHKYFLQVSNSQSPTRGPYRAQSSCKDFEHAGCRSQSLLSVNEERPQQPGEDGLVQTHEASQDEPPVSLHIERQES